MNTKLQANLRVRVSDYIYDQINNKSFVIPMDGVGNIEYFFRFDDQGVLILNAVFPIDSPRFDGEEFNEIFTKDIVARVIYHSEFNVMIHNFFLVFQIADPAGFDIVNMVTFIDGIERDIINKKLIAPLSVSDLYENQSFENILKPIEVEFVLEWLIGQKDFWDEVADSKTGTALNYLRYFYENRSPLGALWLCMGLESLLVENQNFSKNQIYGKLNFLIESRIDEQSLKKYVDSFYSFRSKIVHGKLNLYRPTLIHDAIDAVNNLDDSIHSNETFGLFSLLICLHFMINNKVHVLNFEEKIIYKLK